MFRRGGLLSVVLLSALLFAACGNGPDKATEESSASAGLSIDAKVLTGEPTFIDVDQDGTAMQVIALKDDTDRVRLAFNTCQSCGGSPYAWFEDLGNGTLQCQNCRQTFPLRSVGAENAQGCNPVTITEFTVEDDIVTIPESLLKANRERFTNWKKFS